MALTAQLNKTNLGREYEYEVVNDIEIYSNKKRTLNSNVWGMTFRCEAPMPKIAALAVTFFFQILHLSLFLF